MQGSGPESTQSQEKTAPEEVTAVDNMEVTGLYVNDSYIDDESDQLKLVYLFYTVKATDKNLKAFSKSTDMKIGENVYTSEHNPGARSYASSFYYSDFIEDVYVGSELKVLETFEVPVGDLEVGKEITLRNDRTPGIDNLKLSTDSIVHLDSAEAIAQNADPEGYASEMQKHEPADAEATARVQSAINGYYWKYAPALGTSITMYKTEFFHQTHSKQQPLALLQLEPMRWRQATLSSSMTATDSLSRSPTVGTTMVASISISQPPTASMRDSNSIDAERKSLA